MATTYPEKQIETYKNVCRVIENADYSEMDTLISDDDDHDGKFFWEC